MNRKPPKKQLEPQAGSDPDDVRVALAALVRSAAGKVPPDVMAKILRIRQTIERMLPVTSQLQIGSPELFLIHRTATYYLPTAVQTYMRLPRAYAASHRERDGKTPKQLLLDQLTLLENKMAEVARDLQRNDLDRLRAHGRFLEERLGRSPLSLEPPTPSKNP